MFLGWEVGLTPMEFIASISDALQLVFHHSQFATSFELLLTMHEIFSLIKLSELFINFYQVRSAIELML